MTHLATTATARGSGVDRRGGGLKLNNIVELIAANDGERLAALRQAFPEHADVLRIGQKLGAHTSRPRRFSLTLAREGLATASKTVGPLSVVIARRLKRAKRLRLASSLVLVLASAAGVSSLAVASHTAALVSAVAGVLSGATNLLAQHLESGLLANGQGMRQMLEALIRAEARARAALVELDAVEATELDVCPPELLREINDICALIRKVQIFSE